MQLNSHLKLKKQKYKYTIQFLKNYAESPLHNSFWEVPNMDHPIKMRKTWTPYKKVFENQKVPSIVQVEEHHRTLQSDCLTTMPAHTHLKRKSQTLLFLYIYQYVQNKMSKPLIQGALLIKEYYILIGWQPCLNMNLKKGNTPFLVFIWYVQNRNDHAAKSWGIRPLIFESSLSVNHCI